MDDPTPHSPSLHPLSSCLCDHDATQTAIGSVAVLSNDSSPRVCSPWDTRCPTQNISDEAKDLITKLLRKEPQKRLPLDEVREGQGLR